MDSLAINTDDDHIVLFLYMFQYDLSHFPIEV